MGSFSFWPFIFQHDSKDYIILLADLRKRQDNARYILIDSENVIDVEYSTMTSMGKQFDLILHCQTGFDYFVQLRSIVLFCKRVGWREKNLFFDPLFRWTAKTLDL